MIIYLTFFLLFGTSNYPSESSASEKFELAIQLADHVYVGSVVGKKAKLLYEVESYSLSGSFFESKDFNVCFTNEDVYLREGARYIFFLSENSYRQGKLGGCYWLGSHRDHPFAIPLIEGETGIYGFIVDYNMFYPNCFKPDISFEKNDYGVKSEYYLLKTDYLNRCIGEIKSKMSEEKRTFYKNLKDSEPEF